MVQNLSLKNAEKRMLKRIIHKISQVTCGTKLLDMFSFEADYLDENDFAATKILKAYADALSGNDNIEASAEDVKLMMFACKLGMKNVEGNLLKRIISTVNKMGSAQELFALFDSHDKCSKHCSSESSLLVRAKT